MGGFVRSFFRPKPKPQPKPQPIQQAAVKAAPKGPTAAEIEDEKIKKASVANKRRGRKATMLTGSSGLEDETYLSKKTMLG
jgi:hypothetical protein|tara:strand:+ start:84 stop:326 length:243 start_codon:yes stop_codon:yes gene_type:complete